MGQRVAKLGPKSCYRGRNTVPINPFIHRTHRRFEKRCTGIYLLCRTRVTAASFLLACVGFLHIVWSEWRDKTVWFCVDGGKTDTFTFLQRKQKIALVMRISLILRSNWSSVWISCPLITRFFMANISYLLFWWGLRRKHTCSSLFHSWSYGCQCLLGIHEK